MVEKDGEEERGLQRKKEIRGDEEEKGLQEDGKEERRDQIARRTGIQRCSLTSAAVARVATRVMITGVPGTRAEMKGLYTSGCISRGRSLSGVKSISTRSLISTPEGTITCILWAVCKFLSMLENNTLCGRACSMQNLE